MLRFVVLMMMALAIVPAYSQSAQPSSFREAEIAFSRLSVERRVYVQMLLTAAGYWPAVPNVGFSQRMFKAIQQFQRENGIVENGVIDQAQIVQLESRAAPLLNKWGFREVSHPQRANSIWVPFGLGLNATRDDKGLRWADPHGIVSISYLQFSMTELRFGYEALLQILNREGAIINFKIIRSDFFAISSSKQNGIDVYHRYHRRGNDILGFNLYWRNSEAHLHIERVATLMSGSLWASTTGAPFPRVPALTRPADVAVARPIAPAIPTAPAAPPPAPEPRKSSSGTGFFVSASGDVLTNAHVVDDCGSIFVTPDGGQPVSARVSAKDITNDLALLTTSHKPKRVVGIRTGVRLGESVAAFGFPLAQILSSSGNFTLGNITALAGIRDDSRFLQISAPVQPGNSGGPLFDQSGNVVGVVTSKLNAARVMVATQGDIAQNVNFAIKAAVVANFLETNRLAFEQGKLATTLQPADLATLAQSASAFVSCQ